MSAAQMASVYRFFAELDQAEHRQLQQARDVFVTVLELVAENLTLGGRYAPGTPIDTANARNGWSVMINGAGGAPPYPGPSSDRGARTLAWILAAIRSAVRLGDVVAFVNDVAYIRRLEMGHSQQAPVGMVGLTWAAADRIFADARSAVASGRRRWS